MLVDPEDGGSNLFRNIDYYLPIDPAPNPRRLEWW